MIRALLTIAALPFVIARELAIVALQRWRDADAERTRARVQAVAEALAARRGKRPADVIPCDDPGGCDTTASSGRHGTSPLSKTHCPECGAAVRADGSCPYDRRPCSRFSPSGTGDAGRCGRGHTEAEHAPAVVQHHMPDLDSTVATCGHVVWARSKRVSQDEATWHDGHGRWSVTCPACRSLLDERKARRASTPTWQRVPATDDAPASVRAVTPTGMLVVPIDSVADDESWWTRVAPLCVCGERPADVGGLCPECRSDRD